MAFLGKFLKNMAIKQVTKKHFNRLINLIEADQYEFYLKQPEELDGTTARNLAMRTIMNSYKDVGLEAPEITEEPGQQRSWEELLSHLVSVLVFSELSYDPLIGSWEDTNLVKKTFNKQLGKWSHESVLKKFVRAEVHKKAEAYRGKK
jgi:hypothetical protein